MKIVLTEDVEHLGSRGDTVNVARGYARNYLLPKGLAMEASAGNLRMLELQRGAWEAREAKDAETARELATRLAEIELSVTKKAGESETLYGSVTPAEISELLAAQGIEVERRKIQHEPIKALGNYEVPIKLHREVTASVKLAVVGEEQAGEPQEVDGSA